MSAGTTLDFAGNSLTIGGLSGSGNVTLGAGTMTVNGSAAGTFSGVISGSGGVTAVSTSAGTAVVLAGANTYTGVTNAAAKGGLGFSGNGSALNSSGFIAAGDIRIDNSSTAVANRLGDAAPVTLRGATLQFSGHTATDLNEVFGALTLDVGQSTVYVINNGAAARMTASSLVRNNGALLLLRGYNPVTAQFLGNIDLGFATAPALIGGGGAALTSQSILPYALGDSDPKPPTSSPTPEAVSGGSTRTSTPRPSSTEPRRPTTSG